MTYKSIRAAERDGLRRPKPWQYGGDQIEIKGVTLCRNPSEAVSTKAWRESGYKVLPDAEPHCWRRRFVGDEAKLVGYGVFRLDQVEPIKRRPLNTSRHTQLEE